MLTNIAKLELNQVQGYKGTDQLVVFYLLIDSIFMYLLCFYLSCLVRRTAVKLNVVMQQYAKTFKIILFHY